MVEIMLSEYVHIPEIVRNLNEEINDILQNKKETYNTLKASVITNMPFITDISNPTLKAVEILVDKYGRRIINITKEIQRLIDMKESIDKGLSLLDLDERRIIELRYFNGYCWDRVSRAIKYSKRQCFRIHNKAIEKMALNGTKCVV